MTMQGDDYHLVLTVELVDFFLQLLNLARLDLDLDGVGVRLWRLSLHGTPRLLGGQGGLNGQGGRQLLIHLIRGCSGSLLFLYLLSSAPILDLLLPGLISVRGDKVGQPDRFLISIASKADQGVLVPLGVRSDLQYLGLIFGLFVESATPERRRIMAESNSTVWHCLKVMVQHSPRRCLTPDKYY